MTTGRCAIAVLAVLAFVVVASAQTRPASPATPERGATSKTDVAVTGSRPVTDAALKLLRKRVESVDWNETPFTEVIDWLKTEGDGRVNVIPRWTPLGEENITPDTPVTLQLKDSTVEVVLRETLEAMSPGGELGFRGQENELAIATLSYFNRKLVTRIYDVTDIMIRFPDFGQNAPQIDLQKTRQGGGGSGGGGQSVFSGGTSGSEQGESGEQAEQAMKTRLEDFAKNIQETIAVETWDLGQVGGRGRIRVVNNRYLIITNTLEVHEAIAGPMVFGE